MNSDTPNLANAKPQYQEIVDSITLRLEMQNIKLYSSGATKACATETYNGQLVITYNPWFLNYLEADNYAAVVAVLVHEVAFHYYGDLNNVSFINHEHHRDELEQDWLAGWVLKEKDYSLVDALSLYDLYRFPASYSVPSERARRKSMQRGWLQTGDELDSQPQTQPQHQPEPQHQHQPQSQPEPQHQPQPVPVTRERESSLPRHTVTHERHWSRPLPAIEYDLDYIPRPRVIYRDRYVYREYDWYYERERDDVTLRDVAVGAAAVGLGLLVVRALFR